MPPNEPAPTAPFTDEDRTRVDRRWTIYVCPSCHRSTMDSDRIECECDVEAWDEVTVGPASYITHLEGALEAADELARVVRRFGKTTGSLSTWREVYDTASRYEAARTRAALPTSKED